MDEQAIQAHLQLLHRVRSELGKVIVGQQLVIEEMLTCLMAGGHCILEGVPGLAKTLMISTLSRTLDLQFHRVQFTPDLMPSDIIGTEILEEDHATGKRFFKFQKGPVFTNVLLADEINRTPPKTQAALLEAMQEHCVSYAGASHPLPDPFFVLATQNPVEQAGTYPLPEAQLDRFLMFMRVAYPSVEEEAEILVRTTGLGGQPVERVLGAAELLSIRRMVREVAISDAMLAYATALVRATRPGEGGNTLGKSLVQGYVNWGAGPRAGQALVLCAKARALLHGHYAVTLADLRAVAPSVLRHRVLLNFQAEADGVTADQIISELLATVPEPKSPLA